MLSIPPFPIYCVVKPYNNITFYESTRELIDERLSHIPCVDYLSISLRAPRNHYGWQTYFHNYSVGFRSDPVLKSFCEFPSSLGTLLLVPVKFLVFPPRMILFDLGVLSVRWAHSEVCRNLYLPFVTPSPRLMSPALARAPNHWDHSGAPAEQCSTSFGRSS